jgi:hypothetical protein
LRKLSALIGGIVNSKSDKFMDSGIATLRSEEINKQNKLRGI